MRSPTSRRLLSSAQSSLLSLALVWVLGGCSSSPSELQEWTPADHQHTTGPNQGQVTAEPTTAAPPGLDDLTIVAWRRSCMRCHGVVGRGDGPEGRMVAATDLSVPAWQEATSDAQIAQVIRQGKGAMPPFDLPENTVQGLVKLVRLFHADRVGAGEASAPAPGATPSPAPSAPSASAAAQSAPPAAPSAGDGATP